MNELKPEDVMRALDILDKMDFFQGQRAGRELWNEKPFEVQEQDIADFSQGIEFVKNLITNALALLREKDADIEVCEARVQAKNYRIEELTQVNAELTQTNAEKDAEIERLKEIADAVADSFPVCDGCEGKTELGERTEHCLYEIDGTFCAQRATKMWFALRAENEELHKEIERLTKERDEARRDCAVAEQLHYECKKELEEMSDDILDSVRTERDRYKAESQQYQSAFLKATMDAEQERFQCKNICEPTYKNLLETARAEAITEFAERMEKTLTAQANISSNEMLAACMWCLDLVKNMEKQLKGEADEL